MTVRRKERCASNCSTRIDWFHGGASVAGKQEGLGEPRLRYVAFTTLATGEDLTICYAARRDVWRVPLAARRVSLPPRGVPLRLPPRVVGHGDETPPPARAWPPSSQALPDCDKSTPTAHALPPPLQASPLGELTTLPASASPPAPSSSPRALARGDSTTRSVPVLFHGDQVACVVPRGHDQAIRVLPHHHHCRHRRQVERRSAFFSFLPLPRRSCFV